MSSALLRNGQNIMNSNKNYVKNPSIHTQSNRSNLNTSKFSRDSFNSQFHLRDQKDFINEANKIMRERMKNKGSTINSKSRLKSVVLNDTKEICLKNYLISLLKDKRTDINEKERNITKALRDSENQLDSDYKNFIDFVEETKRKQKKEEEELYKLKNSHEEKDKNLKKESIEFKKLSEDLERTVKIICLLKSYGSFVHKVIGIKFCFDGVPDIDQRERNFEVVSNLILKKYEDMRAIDNELLDDETLLIMKFTEYEDKVIKVLSNQEVIDKEIRYLKSSYDEEIEELKKRVKDCEEEEYRILIEKKNLINSINKLKPHEDSEVERFMKYIVELGLETGNISTKIKNKKNILDYLNFTKDTLNILEEKESLINNYINEIEEIERTGDKKLIHDIEMDRKKHNKREKQLIIKQKQDQIENLKRQKAVERAQRVVIKGRKVPKDYPILKEKKKKKKEGNKNNDNDYEMLYYSSDEN